METTKYPRTYHLPFSEGLQNDDRKVEDGWWEHLKDKTLLLSEKMDGSNSYVCKSGVYARSHATTTDNPWDKNLIEKGGTHDQIKNLLSDNEGIYGENMYGIHSIEYKMLPSYFLMFAARDNNRWYSWKEIEELSSILGLIHVPVLEIRRFETVSELEQAIALHMKNGSKYGNTIEGVVVRNIESFPLDEFSMNVVKYVRKNHVQTDEHWKRNWKRAKLYYEKF